MGNGESAGPILAHRRRYLEAELFFRTKAKARVKAKAPVQTDAPTQQRMWPELLKAKVAKLWELPLTIEDPRRSLGCL